MGKKVTPEEIKRMNELYLTLHTYSGVAKEVGRAPSTVKRYIDPDYLKKKEKASKPLEEIDWNLFIGDREIGKEEKVFWITEKPGMENYYILQNNLAEKGVRTEKSYNIIPSKILGISFEDFLKMCEDGLGAEVNFGRNKLYPSIYFKDNSSTRKFLKVINSLVKSWLENLKNSQNSYIINI